MCTPGGHASEKTPAATQHLLRVTPEEVLLFVIMKCVMKGGLEKKEKTGSCGSAAAVQGAATGSLQAGSFCLILLQKASE